MGVVPWPSRQSIRLEACAVKYLGGPLHAIQRTLPAVLALASLNTRAHRRARMHNTPLYMYVRCIVHA